MLLLVPGADRFVSPSTFNIFSSRFLEYAAGSRYWCQQEEIDGEVFRALKTVHNPSGPVTLGRLSQHSEEVLSAFSLLDHLVRSPASLAFLIEAAPRETLTQAAAILKRRLPWDHD